MHLLLLPIIHQFNKWRKFSKMVRGLVFMIFFTNCLLVRVKAGICSSTDVRNDPNKLTILENCTVIVGNLQILLMEGVSQKTFQQFRFPKLEEITEYLLVYNVENLTSIGLLFPNLRVIRGDKLFNNYALVLYNNVDMINIGLTNLTYIGRGGIIVDRCPKLCYVNTVDWSKIGVQKQLVMYKRPPTCTDHCHNMCKILSKNHCWNYNICQIDGNKGCHKECIGCSLSHSSKHCYLCKNYNDNGCVSKCPKNKYLYSKIRTCMTTEECQKNNLLIFDNQCIDSCPANYKVTTNGSCQQCNGTCHKTCQGGEVNSLARLQDFLGCTYINGSVFLRVVNKHMAEELEFLMGSIEIINGSLKVFLSPDISSLKFFKRLKQITGNHTIKGYSLVVFENANLQELAPIKISNGKLLFFGNPQLCYYKIRKLAEMNLINVSDHDVSKNSNGPEAACIRHQLKMQVIEVNANDATLQWNHPPMTNQDQLLGYTIYYVERDANKSTAFGGNNACDLLCWKSKFVSNNTVKLTHLKPFTNYSFYINILKASSLQERSELFGFRTDFGEPGPPTDFQAVALASDSIQLKWNKPISVNGILHNYEIFSYIEDYSTMLRHQRDYCIQPHAENITEDNFWEDIQNDSIEMDLQDLTCNCHKKTYTNNICDDNVDKSKQFVNSFEHRPIKNIPIAGLKEYKEFQTKNPQIQTINITNLRHFTVYIFYISACNHKPSNSSNIKCSTVVQSFERTHKDPNADKIREIRYRISGQNVTISWKQPINPNGIILAYNIILKANTFQPRICLSTVKDFDKIQNETIHFTFSHLDPDVYEVKIQAVSLAGNGPFKTARFKVSLSHNGIIIFTVIFVAFISGAALFYRYRNKLPLFYRLRNLFKYRKMEEYSDFDKYIEINPSNIELREVYISTNFISIYKAILKPNKACTAKVFDVGDGFNYREILNLFRDEVSRNSACNYCNHTLKLYGIVSRINAPIIVYEYLGLGDLKQFLRKSIYDLPIIDIQHVYRMIAEVADGMVYLGINNIVHKDLSARNCIVTSDHRVKVGDFGLSKTVYKEDYYEVNGQTVPIRWMAPETLKTETFDMESDVWSFGVLVWEILTLAQQPYSNMEDIQVIDYVSNGGRLHRPLDCPDDLYELMMDCWAPAKERPRFVDIVLGLNRHLDEAFRILSYVHNCDKHSEKRSLFQRNPIIVGRFSESRENVNLILN